MNDDRIELQKIGAYLDERLPGALKDPEFLALGGIDLAYAFSAGTPTLEAVYESRELFSLIELYLEKACGIDSIDFKLFYYVFLFASFLERDQDGFCDLDGVWQVPENEFEQYGKSYASFSEFFEEYSRRDHPVPFDWVDDVVMDLVSNESKTDNLLTFNYAFGFIDSFFAGFSTNDLPRKTVQAKAPNVIFLDPSYRDSINSVYRIRQQLFHLAYGAALCQNPQVIEACNRKYVSRFEHNKTDNYEHSQLAPTRLTYDPVYIREVVNDNFEQQRNILDKKYKTQSGIIDLDGLLKKCLDAPISDDEFTANLRRMDELNSIDLRSLSNEEWGEIHKLENYLKGNDEFSCRRNLAVMTMEIFSRQSIFLTYMYCRFHKTEEALKELLKRILIRRRMIIDDIKIDVFYDENGVKYSSSVNPIDIIRQKTGYDALHDLSADELIKAIVDLATRQETAVYKSAERIIAELKAEFMTLPDEVLDGIFIGGRDGLNALKAKDIVLTQIPSESLSKLEKISEFTMDRLGIYPEENYHDTLKLYSGDENCFDALSYGLKRNNSFRLPQTRSAHENGDLLLDSNRKEAKLFDFTASSIVNPDDPVYDFFFSPYESALPSNSTMRNVLGSLLNCPVKEERMPERLVFFEMQRAEEFDEEPVSWPMHEELFEKYRLILCGRTRAFGTLMRAYCEIAKLGLTCEELFWLNAFLVMNEFEHLESELLDGHIARLRNRIYGGRSEKRIKREYNGFENTFEYALMWPLLTEELMDLVEDVSPMKLPKLLEKKKRFVEKCADSGISSSLEAFLVSLLDRLEEKLRAKINEYPDIDGIEALLNEHIIARKDRILELYGGVDGHFKAEATDDAEAGSFDAMTAKVRAFLKTGEVLYKAYVEDENAEPLPDYGCIAIEYYKAIEYLANQLLYRPYYHTVLAARNRVDQSDEELRGYCGNSFLSITTKSGKYKEELEYGTVASFLAGVNGYKWDNSGKSWTRDNNSNKYSKIQNFYSVLKHFNLNRIHRFARNMFDTKDSRNDCAHPKDQGKGFATKARVNVYRDVVSRSEAEAADTLVKELIVELGKLFEQNR